MAVVVGNILRITAKMKLFGTDDIMNVYTYRVDVNATADDTAFMTDVAARLDVHYGALNVDKRTDMSYETISGFNITKDELLPDTDWPVLTVGVNASILMPTQLAACIFWRTTTPKVRTSTFMGGYTTTSLASGSGLAAPIITRLLTFGADMRQLITANITLTKGSFNPTGGIFTESGEAQVPAFFRTQRRRRLGVGS